LNWGSLVIRLHAARTSMFASLLSVFGNTEPWQVMLDPSVSSVTVPVPPFSRGDTADAGLPPPPRELRAAEDDGANGDLSSLAIRAAKSAFVRGQLPCFSAGVWTSGESGRDDRLERLESIELALGLFPFATPA
jgi:hypothetical protein